MAKFSRRKFLEAGTVSSVALIGHPAGTLPILQEQQEPPAQAKAAAASSLPAQQRDLLKAAIDEIIPAGDGMPSASEAGGVEYLELLAKNHARSAKELTEALDALEKGTQGRLKKSFVSLSRAERVEQLKAFEKQEGSVFPVLRGYVYESYYTQPAIQKLVGYTHYPTDGPGPPLKKTFNDACLDVVSKKPKGFVEVT